MTLKIGVGESDFAALREAGSYYVDKTELIYNLVEQTDNEVTIFTRPRRFGKTLMMSMIENFFNVRKDSKNIFEGLNITKHEEFCEKYMNKYPVVFISFKDAEALNFETAYDKLKIVISDFCKKIVDLMENKNIDHDDNTAFYNLKATRANDAEVQNSIRTIMRIMNAVIIHFMVQKIIYGVFS